MAGVDVMPPFEIASVDASIGREAGVGRTAGIAGIAGVQIRQRTVGARPKWSSIFRRAPYEGFRFRKDFFEQALAFSALGHPINGENSATTVSKTRLSFPILLLP